MMTMVRNAFIAGASRAAIVIGVLGFGLQGAALAADQADEAAPQAAEQSSDQSDIVVTARRRGENLAKVPAVVAAFSGEQLAQRGIQQQSDLQSAVPGLVVRQTQSNNNLNYVIRGQSVDAFSGSATAIVPYVNEVQFAPGGSSSFFDLESVQVLKGPQGTLFGRNATGGAVLVTTAKPVNALAGSVKIAAGNFDYVNASAMVNLPLIDDRIILRAAFDSTTREGFQRNLFNGQRPGSIERQVGRISLLIRPTETITNTSVVQVESANGNNSSSVVYSVYQCGQVDPTGRPLTCSAGSLFGPQLDAAIGFPGAWDIYLAAHPGANPDGIFAALAAQQNGRFWDVSENNLTKHRGRNAFLTNTTEIDLGESTQLKNIFGLSRSHNSDLAGQIGVPYLILSTYNALVGPPKLGDNSNDELVRTISEELQLQGKLLDDRLTYVVGGYAARTRSRLFYPATYTDLSPVFPLIPDVSTSLSDFKQEDTQQAVYGQLTYDLGGVGIPGLTANAGYRYTWEKITSDQLARSRFFGQPQLEVKFDKPSWLLGLDYQATPTLLLYAQTRGSWRAGGINGIAPPIDALPDAGGSLYLPETTEDIEIGAKFNGVVAGQRGHLYLATYRQNVKNIQRTQLINVPVGGGVTQPTLFTVNVPKARIQGFEFDAGIDLADWLTIGATGAYTDAKYRDNQLEAFGELYFFGPYGDAPKWSGTLNAQVRLPIAKDRGQLSLRADVYGQTSFYFANTANTRTPGTRLPGYRLVNLRADWSDFMGGEGLTASLFVRNVFNKGYYTGGFALGDLLGVNSANVGEPRMGGAELRYSF
ncbi:hypothetical protein C100_08515 [Sphingobium sp. C100]|nr:hypothetical protein C100_08515 [Sphingobium sp. C100]